MTEVLPVTVAETARLGELILAEVEQVVVGKGEAVRLVLLGVLASGHVLIEDLPGLGKTLLARPGPWLRRQLPLLVAGLIAGGAVLAMDAVHLAASAWITLVGLAAAVAAYLIALPSRSAR